MPTTTEVLPVPAPASTRVTSSSVATASACSFVRRLGSAARTAWTAGALLNTKRLFAFLLASSKLSTGSRDSSRPSASLASRSRCSRTRPSHSRRVGASASWCLRESWYRAYWSPANSWRSSSSSPFRRGLSALATRSASADAASWTRVASSSAASRIRSASDLSSPPMERSVPLVSQIVNRCQNHDGRTVIEPMTPTGILASASPKCS